MTYTIELNPHINEGEKTVNLNPSTTQVYIFRTDFFALNEFIQNYATQNKLPLKETTKKIEKCYRTFMQNVCHIVGQSFLNQHVEIHLFDDDILKKALLKNIKNISKNACLVSLDPGVFGENIFSLGISRLYLKGGESDKGIHNRPGTKRITTQIQNLKKIANHKPLIIIEDDIFSGGSMLSITQKLKENGFDILAIAPGFQVGRSKKLAEFAIKPVCFYEDTLPIELLDPRDFLLGISGLTIQNENHQLARFSYILPFVSPKARASIPKAKEKEFSLNVLNENLKFFQNVEKECGAPILLKYMDKYAALGIQEYFDFKTKDSMTQVIQTALVYLKNTPKQKDLNTTIFIQEASK